jgi:hypothetical protein
VATPPAAKFLRKRHQFLLGHGRQAADVPQYGARVTDRLDHVARSGLAFGADHGRALADAAQGLAEVAAPADERDLEWVFEDVVRFVGGGQDLRLVDVVHADGFQDLRLDEMSDAAFGHDGDRDRVHDLEDQVRIGHARHAAVGADIGRDAFERHYRAGAGIFRDAGVFGGNDVHDDAAFKHLGQTLLKSKSTGLWFHKISPLPRVDSTTPKVSGLLPGLSRGSRRWRNISINLDPFLSVYP